MSKLAEVNQEWETLKSLATEKLTGGELTDFTILTEHYRKQAINFARDYDTQEQEKKHYQLLNNLNKVKDNETKQSEILETLKTFSEIHQRLSQKLVYMENTEKILTELTSLKNNLETLKSSNVLNKCACDTSLLEAKIDKLIEAFNSLPSVDLNPVLNKLNELKYSVNSLNQKPKTVEIGTQTEPITQTTPVEVKKPDQIEQTPNPITAPTKSAEELEKERKNKELQDLKNEVGKLALNDLEKALLKDSQDKEHIEAIRKQAQTRIDKEKEELEKKEKERLALEKAEKERKEREIQELNNLKKEVELLNPNENEKGLLTNADNKEAVENVRKQINERLEKEKAERDKWLKEFQNFKAGIEKLGLNETEQKELDNAIDEWQAKKVKESAETRIKQEKEQQERDYLEKVKLAQEQEELKQLKVKISQLSLNASEIQLLNEASNKSQALALETSVKIRIEREKQEFNNLKAEVGKLSLLEEEKWHLDQATTKEKVKELETKIKVRLEKVAKEEAERAKLNKFLERYMGRAWNTEYYHLISDFKEKIINRKDWTDSGLIYQSKKTGLWGIIYAVKSEAILWISYSKLDDWNIEWDEVVELINSWEIKSISWYNKNSLSLREEKNSNITIKIKMFDFL